MTSAPVLLWRRLTAEFLGSAFLAAVAIGSGIGGVLAAGMIKALYPAITPADAATIIVPHREHAGRAPARGGYDGASPAADRPPGPARSSP